MTLSNPVVPAQGSMEYFRGSTEVIISFIFIILRFREMRLGIKFILQFTILKSACLGARTVLHPLTVPGVSNSLPT